MKRPGKKTAPRKAGAEGNINPVEERKTEKPGHRSRLYDLAGGIVIGGAITLLGVFLTDFLGDIDRLQSTKAEEKDLNAVKVMINYQHEWIFTHACADLGGAVRFNQAAGECQINGQPTGLIYTPPFILTEP